MCHVFVTSVGWKAPKEPEVSKDYLFKYRSWMLCGGCSFFTCFWKTFSYPHSLSEALEWEGEWDFTKENWKWLWRPCLVREPSSFTLPLLALSFCLFLDSSWSTGFLNVGDTQGLVLPTSLSTLYSPLGRPIHKHGFSYPWSLMISTFQPWRLSWTRDHYIKYISPTACPEPYASSSSSETLVSVGMTALTNQLLKPETWEPS